jgi:hypothetical protein
VEGGVFWMVFSLMQWLARPTAIYLQGLSRYEANKVLNDSTTSEVSSEMEEKVQRGIAECIHSHGLYHT